jgi:hypothetical protein
LRRQTGKFFELPHWVGKGGRPPFLPCFVYFVYCIYFD